MHRVRLVAVQGANQVTSIIDVNLIFNVKKSASYTMKTLCRLYISIMFQDPDSIRCFPGPEWDRDRQAVSVRVYGCCGWLMKAIP